jgi:hypothetical protein
MGIWRKRAGRPQTRPKVSAIYGGVSTSPAISDDPAEELARPVERDRRERANIAY